MSNPSSSRYVSKSLYDMMEQSLRLVDQQDGFPFYNIYSGEKEAIIEVAVAGYKKENIEVSVNGMQLQISGKVHGKSGETTGIPLQYKGISLRDFKRVFNLGQYWEVNSVGLVDGILKIALHKNVPPEKQPKVFDIS